MSTPHAGLLVPLDMFRITQLASIFGELLVGKARNVLDAELVVTRHPEAPLFLMNITGSVVDENPAAFWRENADLVQMASRAFPRQVIMFYGDPGATPQDRREGFIVAAQGQVVAGDDADADKFPAGTPDTDWPLGKLCEQLRIPLADLNGRFAGGPQVSVKLLEPAGDDQDLLQVLFAKEMAAQAAAEGGAPAPGPDGQVAAAPAPAQAQAGQAQPGAVPGTPAAPATPPKPSAAELAAEDAKRRARESAEESATAAARAAEIQSGLRLAQDDLGITLAPDAELSEPDQLRPFVVSALQGDAPEGVPRELTQQLQGKRIDVAVKVDFLSEVFIESAPLSKPQFQEISAQRDMGGKSVRVAEVLGPRLGYGTLISTGSAPHVFVSRKPDLPLPESLIIELLG
ncbi:MAG: hypothetical protein KUG77_11980 [Nannocystaceae bacterium]|nr:hypothetical protein [Nannocystaceae bacterium]